jgi:DHA1 family inner membrane transport protein
MAHSSAANTREMTVAIAVGVIGLLIAGVQPLLLGGLADEHRLSVAEIGIAATVELICLGISTGLASGMLKPRHLQPITCAALLVNAALTMACLSASSTFLIILRALAGLSEGIMLWLAISAIARTINPERLSAIFLTAQTLFQLAVVGVGSILILPKFHTNGFLVLLAGISVLGAVLAWAGPGQYAELDHQTHGPKTLSLPPVLGLGSVFLCLAFIVSIWVYIEPLGLRSGLTVAEQHMAPTIALGAQVIGGLFATWLGDRKSPVTLILISGLANLAFLIGLRVGLPSIGFYAFLIMFGFLWLFTLPYYTLLLIKLDPSRHAVLQIGTMQLLGSSAGPLLCSLTVGDNNLSGILLIAMACLVGSLALLLLSVYQARNRAK